MIESISNLQQQLLNPNNLFILAGLLLILSELFIGIEAGLDLVLIGSILIISGFNGVLFSNVWVAVISAIILSVIYFTYGRKIIKSKIIFSAHNSNVDKLISKTAVVTKKISNHHPGQVKVEGERWRAKSSKTFNEGDEVTISTIAGVTLTVKQKQNNKN